MSAASIVDAWVADVKAKGGVAIRTGYPYEPHKGKPGARFPLGENRWRYELAPGSVIEAMAEIRGDEASDIFAGKLIEKAEEAGKRLGLDGGLLGVIGNVLGVSPKVLFGIAVLGGGVLAYGALVQIGIVPPVREIFRKG